MNGVAYDSGCLQVAPVGTVQQEAYDTVIVLA